MPEHKKHYLQIGLDSQCLSCLIDIMGSATRLSEKVGNQQLSLIRLYLYVVKTFWVTPQVHKECNDIPDQEYLLLHNSYMNTLFGVLPLNNPDAVKKNTEEFKDHHKKHGDCVVLAEAQDVKLDILLVFDKKFINRLYGAGSVKLLSPLEYWESLDVPKGSATVNTPAMGNPLGDQNFWWW